MDRFIVELHTDHSDGTKYFLARDEDGCEAESDDVGGFRDAHARIALATQALVRLGERIAADVAWATRAFP
jgi:hypothetical protein